MKYSYKKKLVIVKKWILKFEIFNMFPLVVTLMTFYLFKGIAAMITNPISPEEGIKGIEKEVKYIKKTYKRFFWIPTNVLFILMWIYVFKNL